MKLASLIYQQFLDGKLTKEEAVINLSGYILSGTIDLKTGNQYIGKIESVDEITENYWKKFDNPKNRH
ncbi:MAG: hypothetical protein ABH919_02760 [bacterium]